MNVLITGASGLVGRNIIKQLEQHNSINKIFCLYRKQPVDCQPKKVIPIIGDMESLSRITIKESIHIAVHLVGYWQKEDKKLLYKVNVEGTRNFIEFCKKNCIDSIIYLSTINVNLNRKGVYAKTKLIAENEVINSGLKYIIMRPTLIYGNGDYGMSKLCNMIKKSKLIPVIGNGKAIEQPIYVGEVVEYIQRAVINFKENIIMPIAGKDAMEYENMIKMLAQQMSINIRIVHLPLSIVALGAKMIEMLRISSPITSEQIVHISEDLKVDNNIPQSIYPIVLKSFRDNIQELSYIN